jgi:ligand-binding SRPBCC domain-containing protein
MPVIELTTVIQAPVERVFDLSRSIDLHVASTARTGERAVAGVTGGLIGLEQEVTWRARHLGVWQHLTTRITAFQRPTYFRDSMVSGAFRRFDHDHYFEQADDTSGIYTRMRDVFDFTTPFGLVGKAADWLFLTRYMRALLQERNHVIRQAAESETLWKEYIS